MVYLIEDDESVRKALQRLLRSASIEVRAFASAGEFLQMGEINQEACLVVDIQMQGLTGFELQEELLSKKIRLPTIVISALDDAQMRERARELGATAFFRKPVDGQALIDSINWGMGLPNKSSCSSES